MLFRQQNRLPLCLISKMDLPICSMIIGAKPSVGSSIRINRAGPRSARALATICNCPPERVRARSRLFSFNMGNRA